jgi:hypothetical protein
MTSVGDPTKFEFGGPATYRIVVQGTVDEHWSDRLAGMVTTTTSSGSGLTHTTLLGPLQDQAELKGVLDTLYGLHVPIVKVELETSGWA